jgi:dephospho-CoA kinase
VVVRPIAISGKAGAGKSALAAALVDAMYPDARRVAFADEIKSEVKELFGLEKGDPGGREKLIDHGEGKRNEDPDYWIAKLEWTLEYIVRPGVVPVIDDLRFERELEWCRNRGFYIVRVDAPLECRLDRLRSGGHSLDVVYSRHAGETELDGAEFDFRWSNGGWDGCTIECTAERILRRIRGLVPS